MNVARMTAAARRRRRAAVPKLAVAGDDKFGDYLLVCALRTPCPLLVEVFNLRAQTQDFTPKFRRLEVTFDTALATAAGGRRDGGS